MLVDWNDAGTFTAASGNVTTRTYEISCRTGRDFASQLFGKTVSGRLSALVNNRSGDYSSFNASSPLYGSLYPGHRILLKTGSGDNIWLGYIESIVPGPKVDGNDTVRIEAIGPFGYINQKMVQAGLSTTIDTDDAVKEVLDDAGWDGTPPSGGTQISTGNIQMKVFWTGTVRAMEALQKIEETEGGQLWETTNGEIGFANRDYRVVTSRCTTSQATLTDSLSGTFTYVQVNQEDPMRYIYNEIVAVVNPTTVAPLTTLWRMSENSANSLSPIIPASSTLDIWARFPSKNSSVDGVGVELWYMPERRGTSVYGQWWANSSPNGAGTDMSDLISTVGVDFGNRARMTFTNTSTRDAYLTMCEVVGPPIYLLDPMEVVISDATSQNKFGLRSYPLPGEFYPSREAAVAAATTKLNIFKDPLPLITVTIASNRSSTHLNQVCKRLVADRVTLVATGSSGLGINEDFFIESISHRIDRHKTHTTQWQLLPVIVAGTSTSTSGTGSGTTGFWVLGSSSLDTQTKLAA